MIYDFHCPIPDVIHLLHLKHLILSLELFGDALTGGKLLYQLKKHSFCLLVQIGQITVQFSGDLQLGVQCLTVLPEIPQMPLSPNADGALFFIGQLQARNVVIALQLVPKTNFRVIDILFHDVILQIKIDFCNSIILADYKSPKGGNFLTKCLP